MNNPNSIPPIASPHGDSQHKPNSEQRLWAIGAHASPLLGISFIGPLVVWAMKKDESPFISQHALEALNFQITVLIAALISFLLFFFVIGIFMLIALGFVAVIFPILASVAAANDQPYVYPVSIRLIK